jgi:hypothetical protein
MIVDFSTYKQWMYPLNPATVDRLIIFRSGKNELSTIVPLHICTRPCAMRIMKRQSVVTCQLAGHLHEPGVVRAGQTKAHCEDGVEGNG